jgi:hypothetical protein
VLWSLPEAQHLLGISRTSLYRRIWDGRLMVIRDGGRAFISDAEITRYVEALEATAVRRRKVRAKAADDGAGIEPAQRAS